MKRSQLLPGLLAVAILATSAVTVAAEKKARILMLTNSKEFTHGPVRRKDGKLATSEVAMTQLGQQTGLFDIVCTQEPTDINRENLKNYDIVVFYTQSASELGIADGEKEYFVNEWLKQKGHGFIGFHSAADTYRASNDEQNQKWKWYWDMIGGTFNGHPWNAGNTVTVTVHDTKHPAARGFKPEFQIKDEIYQYKNWQPEKVHVLMSLNMEKCNPKKPYHVPLSWVKDWGKGKVYFTNLGHNDSTWTDKRFLDSVEGGVRWVMGLDAGDATPNPEVSAAEEAKAKKAAGG